MGLVALAALSLDWLAAHAQESSVAGIYLLVEVNGESPPTVTRARSDNGTLCETQVLDGAVLLDSNGRSAAFVTEREFCQPEDASAATARTESAIFPGTYSVSDNRITINDEFGTDQAILEGDLLVYSTGSPTTRYVLRKQSVRSVK